MPWLLPVLLAAGLVLAASPPGAAAPELPTLIVESPPELARLAERVRAFDRSRLAPAMELVGLEEPGPPIYLVLAPEGSPPARSAPDWAAGWADGLRGVAVVLPERVPRYPHQSLEAVIQHEIAHVLLSRAAGGRPVPRWFDEGVAMAAARVWSLEDRTYLTWGVLTGGPDDLPSLEAAFYGASAREARAAYALSSALVRELQQEEGPEVAGKILRRMRGGEELDAAFQAVTGLTAARFARGFFRRQTLWNRWVPLVTSSATLWIAITLLALVAFRRRRQRDAELVRRWEQEDRLWQLRVQRRDPPSPPDELVN